MCSKNERNLREKSIVINSICPLHWQSARIPKIAPVMHIFRIFRVEKAASFVSKSLLWLVLSVPQARVLVIFRASTGDVVRFSTL